MVDTYMYQAALLCDACGCGVRALLQEMKQAPTNPDDESSYDSDDYPKGPYPDGGGEADAPQHCDHCDLFLENPLTNDGAEYVREVIAFRNREGLAQSCVSEWEIFYADVLR